VLRADPGIDIRYSNRNAIFIVLERSRSPLLRHLMLTTHWDGLVIHDQLLLCLASPKWRLVPFFFIRDVRSYKLNVDWIGVFTYNVQVNLNVGG
ncbi:MAG: hypothetical protein DMF75_17735, partial [Acidobacteria bacterium]